MAIGTTLKIGFDGASVQKGLANLAGSMKKLTVQGVGGIVAPFAKLGALLAPTALVGGMVAFGKASSDAAANIENMKAQFELFTGSAEKTESLIKDLRKIAVESPLELTDISGGARNLLTYGVAASKVADITRELSEVSAGSAERFDRISYAFGQINSIGRLMGTELRQLTEAGFNPLENISKKTGESMMDLKKRMEDGKISLNEVEDALRDATSEGGRFYGRNAKMAQTFSGRVSMMKDQWSQLTQAFGTGMNDGLKVAIDATTNSIPKFIESFRAIGTYFGQSIYDAVAGDYSKFVAIGEFIGASIKVGIDAKLAEIQARKERLVAVMASISRRSAG
jgi:tape measure domain-containing protein